MRAGGGLRERRQPGDQQQRGKKANQHVILLPLVMF
jgi:hypothetical protein